MIVLLLMDTFDGHLILIMVEVQHQVSLDHGRFIRLVGEASGCLLQCHFPALELLRDDRWSKSSQ